MSTISKYLSILKTHGLAVNNLYTIQISLPQGTLKVMLESEGSTAFSIEEQKDASKTGYNSQAILGSGVSGIISGGISGYKKEENGGLVGAASGAASGFGGITKAFSPQINSIRNLFGFGGDDPTEQGNSSGFNVNKIEQVELLCTSTQIPFYKHKLSKTFVNHYEHKFASGIDTDPVKMTFYVDRDNAVLGMFYKWHELIHTTYHPVTGSKDGVMKYKNEYAADVTINMVNRNKSGGLEDVFFSGVLKGAYPAYIQPIMLSNGNTEIIQLTVDFEYDRVLHASFGLPTEGIIDIEKLKTGFSVLDFKNKVEQGINNVTDMARTASNIVKSGRTTVDEMKKTAKRVLRF